MVATGSDIPGGGNAPANLSDHGGPNILTHQDACKLVAFLLASAEISTAEPYYYATLRLIDAAGHLLEHINATGTSYGELQNLQGEISAKMHWMMRDRPAYFSFIKSLPPLMVDHLKVHCMTIGEEA